MSRITSYWGDKVQTVPPDSILALQERLQGPVEGEFDPQLAQADVDPQFANGYWHYGGYTSPGGRDLFDYRDRVVQNQLPQETPPPPEQFTPADAMRLNQLRQQQATVERRVDEGRLAPFEGEAVQQQLRPRITRLQALEQLSQMNAQQLQRIRMMQDIAQTTAIQQRNENFLASAAQDRVETVRLPDGTVHHFLRNVNGTTTPLPSQPQAQGPRITPAQVNTISREVRREVENRVATDPAMAWLGRVPAEIGQQWRENEIERQITTRLEQMQRHATGGGQAQSGQRQGGQMGPPAPERSVGTPADAGDVPQASQQAPQAPAVPPQPWDLRQPRNDQQRNEAAGFEVIRNWVGTLPAANRQTAQRDLETVINLSTRYGSREAMRSAGVLEQYIQAFARLDAVRPRAQSRSNFRPFGPFIPNPFGG